MARSQIVIMYIQPWGDTISPLVVKSVTGQLVDVINGAIYPCCVNFRDGKVMRLERKVSAPQHYIIPGLIDSHIHIESSHLTPYRFAEQAVINGTTAVVADPSPTAMALGRPGLDYLSQAAASTPLRLYFTAPSNVPSLGWREVKELLSRPEYVGLGEVTDHAGLLNESSDIMSKLEVARQEGMPVDGHAPGLRGYDLDRYIMAGVSSDHECTSVDEAAYKHRKGLQIMLREGSADKNLRALLPFARDNKFLLATDYLRAVDLAGGHVNQLLRQAVAEGLDPMAAIRAATIWPAQHYGLSGGSIFVGGAADFTVVSDLKTFNVLETWINGEVVAKNGEPLFLGNPPPTPGSFSVPHLKLTELEVTDPGPVVRVRIMEVGEGRGVTWGEANLRVLNMEVLAEPTMDILHLVHVMPGTPPGVRTGFIKGLGLASGALATSELYGLNGVVGVGASLPEVMEAINAVVDMGGGLVAHMDHQRASLQLPVAGLMSDQAGGEIARQESDLAAMVRSMGSRVEDPFLTLAILSPEIRNLFVVREVVEAPSV
mgnify:CR=1 FL=1